MKPKLPIRLFAPIPYRPPKCSSSFQNYSRVSNILRLKPSKPGGKEMAGSNIKEDKGLHNTSLEQ